MAQLSTCGVLASCASEEKTKLMCSIWDLVVFVSFPFPCMASRSEVRAGIFLWRYPETGGHWSYVLR